MMLGTLLQSNNLFVIIESPVMEGESNDEYERVKDRLRLLLYEMEIDEERDINDPITHTREATPVVTGAAPKLIHAEELYPQHQNLIKKITVFQGLLIAQRCEKNLSFLNILTASIDSLGFGIVFLSWLFRELLSFLLLARFAVKLLNYLPLKKSPLFLPRLTVKYQYGTLGLKTSSPGVYANLFSKIACVFDWLYSYVGVFLGASLGMLVFLPIATLGAFIIASCVYIAEKIWRRGRVAHYREIFLNIPEAPKRKDFSMALLMGLHAKNKNSYGLGSVFSSSAIADPKPLKHVFEFLNGAPPSPIPAPALTEKDAHESKGKSPAPRSTSDGELLQTQGIFPHPQPSGQPPTRIAGLDEAEIVPKQMNSQ